MNKSNKLTKADKEELKIARALLENPGIAAKLTNLIGKPIEKGFDIEYFKVGRGMAKYKGEDPLVCRLICKKK